MSATISDLQCLQDYFKGVLQRADHHALSVGEVVFPLIGIIIWKHDKDSAISVRSYNGTLGNVLWFYVSGNRFVLSYEHSKRVIELRRESIQGEVISSFDNGTSIQSLRVLFESL